MDKMAGNVLTLEVYNLILMESLKYKNPVPINNNSAWTQEFFRTLSCFAKGSDKITLLIKHRDFAFETIKNIHVAVIIKIYQSLEVAACILVEQTYLRDIDPKQLFQFHIFSIHKFRRGIVHLDNFIRARMT